MKIYLKIFSSIIIKKKNILKIDVILDLFSVNIELIEKIIEIGPFGQENEEPRIALKNLKVAYKKDSRKIKKTYFLCIRRFFW